ncbi:8-oxoguanine deaminase [Henriciella sp. AS95]|uniref:8-oxoguanine deaminase n=1 Tax=Henriciella sp. AS95 TaxID=3135782 RepID=UPI003174331C
MTTTLICNADVVAVMDDAGTEIEMGAILIENGVVRQVGPQAELSEWHTEADEIVRADGCVVTPGLVNTHHHLFQTLTRAVPAGQDALLFDWLKTLYPIWSRYRLDEIFHSAQLGLAELALSGCTMSTDHLYFHPHPDSLEHSIQAAQSIGIRFHPTRGSMSIGESQGGLPPDSMVENEADILKDCIDAIDRFHDPSDGAMLRVALAPCSPFSVSQDLMRDTALLARDKGVMMHTHLAENDQDIAYSLEKFGCRPGEYAERLGWVGPDVWHAHCVKLDADEIELFARTGTGVAHCPCSNCRLGSGIAPVRQMLSAGVPIGLGVDGSASNDAGHLLLEARQAMLLQRVANGADAMSARAALHLATRGGAEMLGRSDCGTLEAGKRADLTVWDTTGLQTAGAWDPIAALVLCAPVSARHVYVDGKAIVVDGHLNGDDDVNDIRNHAEASLKWLMG